MRMRPIHYILVLTLINLCFTSNAQEVRGLNYNPVIKSAASEVKLKSTATANRKIPKPDSSFYFFDDFSTYGTNIYPESENWINNQATVTLSYSDSAISFGVATLDCFDSAGYVYGSIGRVNASDTLTSCLIDSIYGDSLYLSFFIQGGGKVDAPEEDDSLIVEFMNRDTTILAWSTKGYESHTFNQITLAIDSAFVSIDSTFQFRFINFTSLSTSEVQGNQGALSNADNWHIDYIQIKKVGAASDMEKINDACVYEPLEPVLYDYSVVPAAHLKYTSGYLRGTNRIKFRTIFPDSTGELSISRSHIYYDIIHNIPLEAQPDATALPSPPQFNGFYEANDPFNPVFKAYEYENDTVRVCQLKSYITVSDFQNQYHWNDTITREEVFADYYAYDDGTAELGFGIAGADATNSAFASEFELYHQTGIPEKLTGVYIYFNHAADLYNADLEFRLAIWNSTNSEPGDLLYLSDDYYTPDTTKGLNNPSSSSNDFMRIPLDEEIEISDNYFVGLIQNTSEFLNVGYDISNNSKSKIWYFSESSWKSAASLSTIPEGSLMIRPIFHQDSPLSIKDKEYLKTQDISIYPNPVKNSFSIDLPLQESNYYDYKLSIYNVLGKKVLSTSLEKITDISHLPVGMYIIQLQNINSLETFSKKILKTE